MAEGDIVSILKERFPGISEDAAAKCLIIPAEDIHNVCMFLNRELSFDYFACLSSLDYKDKLGLVYNLYSFARKEKICLKVFLERNSPRVRSVSGIWPAANWQEREAFDMMGIIFSGHPDPRRILLPDDWQGHPLRKDYRREGLVPMPQV